MPKIKYGLKNVYYAPITAMTDAGVPTYSTPVAWPGAVNLNMEPQGERIVFHADNIEYWTMVPNDGYDGDYESALVPDSFLKDVLGYIEDAAGVLVEDANAKPKEFALLFQFENDDSETRHVMYRISAGRPAVVGATKGENVEPQTETSAFRALAIHNASLDTDIVKAKAKTTDTPYANWFQSVYIPTAST
ncbi:MAG: phage tail protein [Blautia sp.]|nr:phage tail protein [Blautia sp.]